MYALSYTLSIVICDTFYKHIARENAYAKSHRPYGNL